MTIFAIISIKIYLETQNFQKVFHINTATWHIEFTQYCEVFSSHFAKFVTFLCQCLLDPSKIIYKVAKLFKLSDQLYINYSEKGSSDLVAEFHYIVNFGTHASYDCNCIPIHSKPDFCYKFNQKQLLGYKVNYQVDV